ncbi:esterase FrsA [Vibrio crassostreae]|uniref:alpha/beta hydrolase n=1 Tax=Vibrio crassostreae TaxID=246167 RepID=UPI001B304E90|nr:alpha/beta hydrolase [Vibrio crassostreae]CAK1691269.1 esterase FrsA [Vibrio crassostreae]CAK1707913.1 esterase FrsA [Vibrio crassostreae]CAK1726094.1 esterase FrsA [Vibrio crassostreae]CAK1727060.1 esterase FrsA [Vibrio crassostreae]CAK1727243.1 esterase FrsA [Vibrio crassostreae]
MKKILLASLISCAAAAPVFAEDDNMTAHTAFKSDLAQNQDHFYRSLRVDEWEKMGLEKADFTSTVKRLKSSTADGLLDSNNENRKGFWTYEFTQSAEAIEALAHRDNRAESYDRASTAYLVAAYPNLQRPNEIVAMKKAVEMYLTAAEIRGEKVHKVLMTREDGRSIIGLLHLPTTRSNNLPAIMWSGGVDKTLIEHKHDIKPLIDKGYAVLTFDIPGAGLDYKNHIEVGYERASHVAAFNFLSSNKIVDSTRIGVLGSSGAGPSLLDFALHQEGLKAVVARCALVDGPIGKTETLKFIPRMSSDSFIARIGGDVSDMSYFELMAPQFSLNNKGLFDGKARIDVPLLAINTKKDPVAMPDDVKKTASLSSKGEVYISDEFGHCPDNQAASDRIIQFLSDNI